MPDQVRTIARLPLQNTTNSCHHVSTIIPYQPSIHPKLLPTRAGHNLLHIARGAELSVNGTDSVIFSTSVAGGTDLKRVVRVSRTISAVGVSAPALAVEVANREILVDGNIPN